MDNGKINHRLRHLTETAGMLMRHVTRTDSRHFYVTRHPLRAKE